MVVLGGGYECTGDLFSITEKMMSLIEKISKMLREEKIVEGPFF
jgi:hypothetical protein